jgi:cytochrome c oxidase subunit III
MSSSDSHAAAHAPRHPNLAGHFDTIQQQDYAARLGMWLFLGTEVLLFAGLFLGYTVYRHFYHETFHHCSRALNVWMGMGNTLVLITSSLTVAVAYWAVKVGKRKLALGLLAFTILCAFVFLYIKYLEYSHKFHVGELPGKWFHAEELMQYPAANMYFTIYFLTTGLHAFHVIVGASVLLWVMKGIAKGKYNPNYYVPVELGALYWHLVDLVWIFLFPLLYLI